MSLGAIKLRSISFSRTCTVCGVKISSGSRCSRHPGKRGMDSAHWRSLRSLALMRDGGQCQFRLDGCTGTATTVHIRPELGGDHDAATLDDCTSGCAHCHGVTDGGRGPYVPGPEAA